MIALTGEQMMAWLEQTSMGWSKLLSEHPEALALPCDVYGVKTVGELLQHIVAVELRYAQRLAQMPESDYEVIALGSADEMYATHERAMGLLRELLGEADFDWEEKIEFVTRSAGRVKSPRRAVLVHTAMHSIRHYAQLATLVRQHGIKPGWAMDYLFMEAERA